jgi:peptidyl-prolyl cis-trans isomerase SurA
MLSLIFIVVNLANLLSAAVVVDRVAIIVGKRVVKASDIERDLRASQFMNNEPLDISAEARKKVADRLIIQELVRQEIMNGGYKQPSESEADALLRQQRPNRAGLSWYGLTEDQLRRYVLWQLTVLRFIDQRFRPGVLVTDEDVRTYYAEHRAELQKAYPKNNSLEALQPKIEEIIAGERVNERFEEWIEETKRRTRIEVRDPALVGALPPPRGSAPGVSK